jgi:hypothetical protein
MAGTRPPPPAAGDWDRALIADGGYRDYFGAEELLVRRCRVVIVSDAGCNTGNYEFGALADFLRQMRLDHGIEILDYDNDAPLDVERLRRARSDDNESNQRFLIGRIRYSACRLAGQKQAATFGTFIYAQMTLTGNEDIDLAEFRQLNPQFPYEPTTNQFYTPAQVESFRQLGQQTARELLDRYRPQENGADPDVRVTAFVDSMVRAYRNDCRDETGIAADDVAPKHFQPIEDPANPRPAAGEKEDTYAAARVVWACLEPEVFQRAEWLCGQNLNDAVQKVRAALPAPMNTGFRKQHVKAASIALMALQLNREAVRASATGKKEIFQPGGRRLLVYRTVSVKLFEPEPGDAMLHQLQPGQWAAYLLDIYRRVFRHRRLETTVALAIGLANLTGGGGGANESALFRNATAQLRRALRRESMPMLSAALKALVLEVAAVKKAAAEQD